MTLQLLRLILDWSINSGSSISQVLVLMLLLHMPYAQKSGRGFFTYAFQTVREPVPLYQRSLTNKEPASGTYTTAFSCSSFANSSQWGYGAQISPHARTDRGLLDLCLVKNFPRILSPALVIRLFKDPYTDQDSSISCTLIRQR